MLGLLEDYRLRVPSSFPLPGLAIYLAGETFAELGGSEFAEAVLGVVAGKPPALDLSKERALHRFLIAAAGGAALASAHDCGDGGRVTEPEPEYLRSISRRRRPHVWRDLPVRRWWNV